MTSSAPCFDCNPEDFLTVLLNQVGAKHKPNTLEELLARLSLGKTANLPKKVREFLANSSCP
jgi:hypothetical protein